MMESKNILEGYFGSSAEKEDISLGIQLDGYCRLEDGGNAVAKITVIETDCDGDPIFTLEFPDHTEIQVMRCEIVPV